MGAPPVDDKPSDTLVVVSGEGFWTGSSTLPHLHHMTGVGANATAGGTGVCGAPPCQMRPCWLGPSGPTCDRSADGSEPESDYGVR